EQQFRGYNLGNNRNMLTTNAVARLLTEIVLGKTNTPARTKIMMDLMRRDWEAQIGKTDDREFISYALKPGTKLWTKEGDTSKTRHDAAYIETPDGLKFVLVIFTENFANERDIIPSIAGKILDKLGEIK
ncbi:MAG: serine hydrolase, partial [Pyrinomonadaceae bacterium]